MGGSGSKTVLNELHGLQERLIDGLAAPELADRRAENARLRALLGDAVRVIGQLRGVDGDDAAAGDAEAKEAAAEAPRPFRAAELDDAVAVRSRAAVDDLAPVDADAVIRRGVPWSDPDFPAANVPSLGDAATVAAKRWGDVAWVRARALVWRRFGRSQRRRRTRLSAASRRRTSSSTPGAARGRPSSTRASPAPSWRAATQRGAAPPAPIEAATGSRPRGSSTSRPWTAPPSPTPTPTRIWT